MYGALWHRLPGGLPGKLLGSLLLTVGVVALLFFVVFPWASPKLPFNDVTVDPTSTPTPTATATVSPS